MKLETNRLTSFFLLVLTFSSIACMPVNAQLDKSRPLPQVLSEDEKKIRLDTFREGWIAVEKLKEEVTNGGPDVITNYEIKRYNKEMDEQLLTDFHFLKQYYEYDGYIITLRYLNNQDYPTLYGGSDFFDKSPGKEFYELKSKEIFEYYLGDDYVSLKPKLRAVTDSVSLSLIVKTVDQLESLLSDPTITDVRHLRGYGSEGLSY